MHLSVNVTAIGQTGRAFSALMHGQALVMDTPLILNNQGFPHRVCSFFALPKLALG